MSLIDIQNTIGNTTKENGTVVLNPERVNYVFDKIRVDYSQTSSASSCYLTIDYAETKTTALEIATNNISGYYINEDRNSYTSVATLKANGTLVGESVYEYDLNAICNTSGKLFYARLWQKNFLPGQVEVYVSSVNNSDCVVASGRCGDNLLWQLSCDSVLTINGSGAMWEDMWDSVGNSSPWYDYNNQIAAFAIGDGITYINEESFNHDVQTILFNGTIDQWLDKQWSPTQIATIYNLYINDEKLVDLVIPDGITRLNENVFNGCISLQSVSVPTSVSEWGDNAFNNCDNIKAVYITDLEKWCNIKCNAFSGTPLHVAKHLYLNNCEITGELVIPNTLDSVGNWAFVNCVGISSVVIPEGILSIGDGSFNTCKNITSVSMPNTLKNIGFASFMACESLQNLIVPDNVEMIDQYAFRNCYNLESVTLGKGLTEIGNWSFSDCHKLRTVICQENLQRIGSIAFGYDSLLTAIEFPSSVTSIGEVAFYNCIGLKSIICRAANPPSLGGNVFNAVDRSIPLYVPAESIDAYKTADQWNEFLNILPIGSIPTSSEHSEEPLIQQKFICNGQLFILREGNIYSVQGQEVR